MYTPRKQSEQARMQQQQCVAHKVWIVVVVVSGQSERRLRVNVGANFCTHTQNVNSNIYNPGTRLTINYANPELTFSSISASMLEDEVTFGRSLALKGGLSGRYVPYTQIPTRNVMLRGIKTKTHSRVCHNLMALHKYLTKVLQWTYFVHRERLGLQNRHKSKPVNMTH